MKGAKSRPGPFEIVIDAFFDVETQDKSYSEHDKKGIVNRDYNECNIV